MSATNASIIPLGLNPEVLGINLNNSLGAAFIGLIISTVLYGVTIVQCIQYFENFWRDPAYMKLIVGILLFLDTLHVLLISHTMYTFLVLDFGDYLAISKTLWSLQTMVLVTVLSCCIVDMCYLHRVWIISEKNRLLVFPPLVIVLVSSGIGLGIGIKCFQFESFLQVDQISWMLYTSFSGAIISDVWITSSLCYFLAKNRTGFSATSKKISVLMTYIINTGFLTSICAISILVTFAAMPHSYVFLALYESYSKVFLNALLAMLNARGKLSGSSSRRLSGKFSKNGSKDAINMLRLREVVAIGSENERKLGSASFDRRNNGAARVDSQFTEFADSREDGGLAAKVSTETDYRSEEFKVARKAGQGHLTGLPI